MATNPSNANSDLNFRSASPTDPSLRGATDEVARATDGREVLQALLAFSTLHDQIRRRRAEEARRFEAGLSPAGDIWEFEQFVLDEVLQLVAERAQAITGADGIAIALAEGDEIVCRASAGTMAPDRGVRLDTKAGFSGACFRTGRVVRCDDSENDPRVNLEACRRLGTRSMVAVPLLGQSRVVGLLEAFSTEPFGFHDADVRSLNLLAELIPGAVRPEEEERIERAAQAAAAELQSAELENLRKTPLSPPAQPASESYGEDLPLEFSQESIAPHFETTLAQGLRPGLTIIVLAVLLVTLLACGVWWWARSPSSSGSTPVTPDTRPVQTAASVPSSVNGGGTVPTTNTATSTPIPGLALVTGVRQFASGETSTVVVDLQSRVQYESHRLSDPERIYFDLLNTSLAPGLNGKVIDAQDGKIGGVRVAEPADNITRVVLYLKPGTICQHHLEENPVRLVIEVGSKQAAAPEPTINPQQATPAIDKSELRPALAPPSRREDTGPRAHLGRLRIVIDAGHGGWDLGTIGRGGLVEKDLVLEVAQRLGNLLESRLGSEVIYTRKDDNYIPLEQRAELANQVQADLFISVHANYSDLLTARGVETYYSSFFSPPEAREIEFRENGNATPVIQSKLSGSELKEKVAESRKLAASVQRALHATLASQNTGIRDRGVKEASFVVLTGTAMPSILAEISFVSSPTDEQRLRSTEYRQQIANALCKGIEQFAVNFRRVKMASAGNRSAGQ